MKKKFIACLLTLTLSMFPITIGAEDTDISMNLPDISGLSLEELYALRDLVNTNILENGGGYDISSGIYFAGIDIEEGSYELYVPSNGVGVIVSVIDSVDTYNEHMEECSSIIGSSRYAKYYTGLSVGQSAHITLNEDDVLIIKYNAIITKANTPFAP